MNIGKNILELRKRKNLSQEVLAEKLGVTRQTISKWELNETSPDLKQAYSLSEFFGITIDELVNNKSKDIVLEKVSNTEVLAKLIIKILKITGLILLVLFIIDIISLVLFTVHKSSTTITEEIMLECTLNNEDYVSININNSKGYQCINCDKNLRNEIKELIDFKNIEWSSKNIEKYFENNNGYCK